MEHSLTTDVTQATPTWVRALSIPTAAIGVIAFFLPWFQVSCGPMHVSFSGYDMASGEINKKLDTQRVESPYKRLFQGQARRRAHSPSTAVSPDNETSRRPLGRNATPSNSDPLLWIVPGACAVLFLMALFGLPRLPTILVSGVGAAYLAYFWVTGDRAASDPANTGGILTFDWQMGFWTTWVGLIVPMIAALLKPRVSRLALYVQPNGYLIPPHPVARLNRVNPPAPTSNLSMEVGGEPQFAGLALKDTWTEPRSQSPAPQAVACLVCRFASAVWRCATHGLMLCAQCRPHYQCPPPSYGCNWQPVQTSQPRTVMTSPLGGLR
jgi:hypothetical protein